mmetsp:Transcript_67332/g.191045  ORF Transcript_67332/g.191045 Transcript_67332/m.191045 type:complete len:245 (-) Transcript_67332:148-882(-)
MWYVRKFPEEHEIRHHTERPDVGGNPVPTRQHLGGHERRCAELTRKAAARRLHGRQIEIAQLHSDPIEADQIVVRFDIAVRHRGLVASFHAKKHLAQEVREPRLQQPRVRVALLCHSALAPLHDHEDLVLLHHRREEVHDMLVPLDSRPAGEFADDLLHEHARGRGRFRSPTASFVGLLLLIIQLFLSDSAGSAELQRHNLHGQVLVGVVGVAPAGSLHVREATAAEHRSQRERRLELAPAAVL